MVLSCLGLMTLLFLLGQEVNPKGSQHLFHTNNMHKWHLDESFIVAIILILILSMGSSSMVEEEQYIWHFMTTSLYFVLLRRTLQSITMGSNFLTSSPSSIYYIIAVLISGRILRGWHQGGVNWSYLPDISKLLEEAGATYVNSLHLLSLVLIIICLAVLFALRVKVRLVMLLMLIYLFPALMILKQILKYQDEAFTSSSVDSTRMIQTIYALIGTSTVGILVAVPWLMPLQDTKTSRGRLKLANDVLQESRFQHLLCSLGDSIYVIGWCYIFSWCLLQMLLQQPINSVPTALLLLQILASIRYFSEGGLHLKQWVKVR